MSKDIEQAIEAEDWSAARALIKRRLRATPDDHWLLTRLGLTYYEQRKYAQALKLEERALALAPRCPLVLWDFAGSLEMLGRYEEAIAVYRRLIRRGVESIANDECGEGLRWARGLVADCHYRLAGCYEHLGSKAAAWRALERHLDLRGPGCSSIYPLAEVRREFASARRSRPHS